MKRFTETASDRRAKQRSFGLLGSLTCAVRLVYSASVFLQNSGTASWAEALLGALLAFPAMLLVWGALRLRGGVPAQRGCESERKLIYAVFLLLFTFDSASWMYSLAESSSYTTFTSTDIIFLYLPTFIVTLLIASRGANACGGLARGAAWVCAFLLSLVMLWQLSEMHPVWLTPIWGGGLRVLGGGTVFCAGTAALYPAGIWLFWQMESEGIEKAEQGGFLRGLLWAALAAMAFLLLYGMLAPNIPNAPHIRSFTMERLLTGGGRGTSVHFPSLLSWYLLLLLSSVFSLFCAACCLRLLFPSRGLLFCSALSALLCIPWTPLRMFWRKGEDWMVFLSLVLVSAASLWAFLRALLEKRREKHAQN